jgi:hypothetical protein
MSGNITNLEIFSLVKMETGIKNNPKPQINTQFYGNSNRETKG